jgi:hypothetical protein
MKAGFWVAVLTPALCAVGFAQSMKPSSSVRLELTMEVATTNDDGNPSALLVTVKNVGGITVTMPVLGGGCHPDNGVQIESFWTSADGQRGSGGGLGCGITDQPALAERARGQWIRLRPGEYMTTMLRFDVGQKEAGTVSYWIEYTPPDATPTEIEELSQEGYVIPTDKLETEHRSFFIY